MWTDLWPLAGMLALYVTLFGVSRLCMVLGLRVARGRRVGAPIRA